jgi:hypothetical protein
MPPTTDDDQTTPRAWTRADSRTFPEHSACLACDEDFQVGQMVTERPPLSLQFYHAEPEDCAQ